MDPKALRSRGRNDQADAYWRRRFFTLVAGLGVLGLLAWALSGTVGGKSPHQAATGPGQGGNGNLSAAAYGSAAPGQPGDTVPAGTPSGQASAQASVSLPATATPQATASGRAQPAEKKTSQPAKARPAAGTPGGVCPAADVVLTLSVGQTVYGPGARPRFQIDIVSTDATPCAFNVGRRSLRILITGGTRATWDSGACLRGATAHAEDLRRGVPSVVSIVWNRQLRAGSCATASVAAGPGRYEAMAASGSVVSPPRAFVLR